MKAKTLQKWIPLAVLAVALSGTVCLSDQATNIICPPSAIQPNGDPNDTIRNFGVWYTWSGLANEVFDPTMHSSNNIPGSIHVTFDCPGSTGDGRSANLAFGNFLSPIGDNNWLGADIAG